jgi:hypothetical protein
MCNDIVSHFFTHLQDFGKLYKTLTNWAPTMEDQDYFFKQVYSRCMTRSLNI